MEKLFPKVSGSVVSTIVSNSIRSLLRQSSAPIVDTPVMPTARKLGIQNLSQFKDRLPIFRGWTRWAHTRLSASMGTRAFDTLRTTILATIWLLPAMLLRAHGCAVSAEHRTLPSLQPSVPSVDTNARISEWASINYGDVLELTSV